MPPMGSARSAVFLVLLLEGAYVAGLAPTAAGAAASMTGPFPSTTALNDPPCNLPSPSGSSSTCSFAGLLASSDACASSCLGNSTCTSYTWHDATMGSYANACIFRTDGAWVPLTGATGHVAGRKVPAPAPVPWPVQDGYDRLPVMWFGANSSGLDSQDTLALIARHRVGGYGWQQGTGTLQPQDNLGRGEVHLSMAATHLTDYLAALPGRNSNSTLVFVYRQIQVALGLFETGLSAARDPANEAFWLHDPATGARCAARQPWGTADPFWNFSAPAAADLWLSSTVAEVASEAPTIGAVFFDEVDEAYCGYWSKAQAGCPAQDAATQRQLQASNNAMLARMVAQLNAAGLIPILSLDNRFAASSDNLPGAPLPCPLPEDATVAAIAAVNGSWARFYENWPSSYWVEDGPDLRAAMIASALLEGQQVGVPMLMHSPVGTCPDPNPGRNITRPGRLGGSLERSLAAFLVVQTPQSVFSASGNWYDADFCWHPEYDVEYGAPLGPATRTGPHSWTRNFTRCNVEVDTSADSGAVFVLP